MVVVVVVVVVCCVGWVFASESFLFFLFFSGTQQSPKSLLSVRSKLYELLTNCIPADLIIKELTRHIMRKCDDQLKIKIAKWSAFYEHRLHLGKRFSLS